MRSVTIAEAEQRNLADMLDSAATGPVLIRREDRDFVLLSAADFAEAQSLLQHERIRQLQQVRFQASDEAKANGLIEEMLPELLRD